MNLLFLYLIFLGVLIGFIFPYLFSEVSNFTVLLGAGLVFGLTWFFMHKIMTTIERIKK